MMGWAGRGVGWAGVFGCMLLVHVGAGFTRAEAKPRPALAQATEQSGGRLLLRGGDFGMGGTWRQKDG